MAPTGAATGAAAGAAGLLLPLLLAADGVARAAAAADDMPPANCGPRFQSPGAPMHATDLNGATLPDVCFVHMPPYHVFVIGDWGGVVPLQGGPEQLAADPVPADHRSKAFGAHHREFVAGADDCAQQRVARQMKARANRSRPDYILNVGDNFYWGGIVAHCGAPAFQHLSTGQWRRVFEQIYDGPEIGDKQWLGVLGNHDYGGYMFTAGWDQVIGYTWAGKEQGSTDRWVTPAQYWRTRVWYPDFSVEYYFLDSNVFTAWAPDVFMEHNICGRTHNPGNANCGPEGPESLDDCPHWFSRLWQEQADWVERHLSQTKSDWQIIVTHVPPDAGKEGWQYLVDRYGIDLILTGHRHNQEIWGPDREGNFLAPTAFLVSGGGGGITSQGVPRTDGNDDQYGFFDLALAKDEIKVQAVTHGGQLRSSVTVRPRKGKHLSKALLLKFPLTGGKGKEMSPFKKVGTWMKDTPAPLLL